jgi:hypothetical protein
MVKKTAKFIFYSVIFILGILFLAKFGAPSFLRLYIQIGIGGCDTVPILCTVPEKEIIYAKPDSQYGLSLSRYKLPGMSAGLPRGFSIVKEKIKKLSFKKKNSYSTASFVYLLSEKPGFFIELYPQIKKQEVNNNYDYISRVMNADIKGVKNTTDAFFVIMKGIFIPDIADQKTAKMIRFAVEDKRGFINYNLTPEGNYFDCNIVDVRDNFFKVYIKDRAASLDLEKVFTIISTINSTQAAEIKK